MIKQWTNSWLPLSAALVIMIGCGGEYKISDGDCQDTELADDSANGDASTASKQSPSQGGSNSAATGSSSNYRPEDASDDASPKATSPASGASLAFTGYVNGVFEVVVDGASYADLEDFYSQELDKLPEKVAAAGYGDDYTIHFDAQVGYQDFWRNMDVWIAPDTKRGYQGHSRLDSNGKFAITLPGAAADKSYKVKASKRINILLTRRAEQVKLCYNFTAREQDVSLEAAADPIILATFTTEVTKYNCDQVTRGLAIPKSGSASGSSGASADNLPSSKQGSSKDATPEKIKKGDSRATVLAVLGTTDLVSDQDAQQLCWANTSQLADVCRAEISQDCQCRVDFDSRGRVSDIQAVRSDLVRD